jgi:hypothetical protein
MLAFMDRAYLTFCPEESDDERLNYKLRDNRCQIVNSDSWLEIQWFSMYHVRAGLNPALHH